MNSLSLTIVGNAPKKEVRKYSHPIKKNGKLISYGIIIKEYSPEYIDKNQSFPPDKFEFDFFSFKIEGKKVTICILENTTGKSRSIKFICRHVNTYHTITVVQLPDINIIEHSGN